MNTGVKYILLILPVAVCNITAQSSWESSPLLQAYKKGEAMYLEGCYRGSRDITTEFAEKAEDLPVIKDRSKFLCAQSAFMAGDADAERVLKEFILNCYAPENIQQARLLLGNLYMREGEYKKAGAEYEKINPSELGKSSREELLLNSGIIKLKAEDYEGALPLFSKLAAESVRFRNDGIFYKACIDYHSGNYTEAEKGFDKIVTDKKYGTESEYYLTGIYFVDKRYARAFSAGEKLLQENNEGEHREEMLRICGESAFMNGNRQKCILYLGQYRTLAKAPEGNALYMLGISYYMDKRYGEALLSLGEVSGTNSTLTQSSFLYLGHSYIASGDKDGALMAYKNASESDADMQTKETALYNYALLLNETSLISFDKSVEVFEKYLNLFPDSKNAEAINSLLAERYFTTHNYDAALASIKKIKNPAPAILKAKQAILYRMGTEAYINGRDQEAYDLFTQTINMGDYAKGIGGKASFWRGEITYSSKMYNEAAADFTRHIKVLGTSADPMAYYNLGYIKFKTMSYNDAIRFFDSYVKNIDTKGDVKIVADAWNRIGDCRYMIKDYQMSVQAYGRSLEVSPETGDYPLFRTGLVAGIQKRFGEKEEIMKRLVHNYPVSPYLPEAMLEQGFAMLEQGKTVEAVACFDNLSQKFPKSNAAKTGSLQSAMAYINKGNTDKAITAYKNVIEGYSGSEEAKIAANDLKNIYLQNGDIASYTEYLKGIGNGTIKYEVSEMDSLTFLSAENAFLKLPGEKSLSRMTAYMQSYPDGAFIPDAAFYIGKYRYDNDDFANGRAHLETVLKTEGGRFADDALEMLADIEEKSKNYKVSQQYYMLLAAKSTSPEVINSSKIGTLRVSLALKDYSNVISEASALLNGNLTGGTEKGVFYLRAEAYMATGKSAEAAADWEKLSSDPRSVYGAEATYQLGQYKFDNKEIKQAEEIINKLISGGSSHKYWVARGIILLSDISAAKGDKFKAKQYLKSLNENYEGKDDVKKHINDRLNKY